MEWIGRERKDSENRIISQIDQGWSIDNIKKKFAEKWNGVDITSNDMRINALI